MVDHRAIATEGRALHAAAKVGLTFYAPNINIVRDPRWGRNQETPGEDPYLSGRYAAAFVSGIQEGDDPRCLKAVATCKHYAAYSLEDWGGVDRHHFNAKVSDKDLVESYLPAFEACVREGRAQSVMCSYNEVNGVPSCASGFLLDDVLRTDLEFGGFVASDCDAVADIHTTHAYASTPAAACADALLAGTDSDCTAYYGQHLGDALTQGLVTRADIDRSAVRLFTYRFWLGMFDTARECSYQAIPPTEVDTPAHRALALQLAQEGIVLLVNTNSTLPLDAAMQTVALIGPQADNPTSQLSNYHGKPPFAPVTALDGLRNNGATVTYERGCDIQSNDTSGFAAAVAAAAAADVAVVMVGLDDTLENEGHDRTVLTLPGVQSGLVQAVVERPGGGPTVVVLVNGGVVADAYAFEHADAVIEAFYPGEYGGQAVADVLTGAVNPGARLPVTVYTAAFTTTNDMKDMAMTAAPGRTYRYLQDEPHFWFGHGLSYTEFNVTWEALPSSSSRAGDDVVLAFLEGDGAATPRQQLFGFDRVHLAPGEQQEVVFTLPPDARTVVTADGTRVPRPAGAVGVVIGGVRGVIELA